MKKKKKKGRKRREVEEDRGGGHFGQFKYAIIYSGGGAFLVKSNMQ